MKLTLKPRILAEISSQAHQRGESAAKYINSILEAVATGELTYPQKEGTNGKERQ